MIHLYIYIFFLCIGVLLQVCVCEVVRSPGTGVTYVCELPGECQASIADALEDQSALFNAIFPASALFCFEGGMFKGC